MFKPGDEVREVAYPTAILTVSAVTSDGWIIAKYGDGFALSFAAAQLRQA